MDPSDFDADPDPDPGAMDPEFQTCIRIRIPNTDPDADPDSWCS